VNVADFAAVLVSQGANGPPLSDAKIVKAWITDPTSVPAQATVKLVAGSVAGNASTLLAGGLLSIAFVQIDCSHNTCSYSASSANWHGRGLTAFSRGPRALRPDPSHPSTGGSEVTK
jgi:hypothetical protein